MLWHSASEADGGAILARDGGTRDDAVTQDVGADRGGDVDRDSRVGPIPVEAFMGDLSDCPQRYRDIKPTAGINTRYVVADQSRTFFMGIPDREVYEGPRPVLFGFNGTTGNGPQFYSGAKLASAVERGFIVLAPSSNGNGSIWPVWDAQRNAGDTRSNPDLMYFDSLLSCVAAHYEVDKNRIYATGHSAGGIMTNFMLRQRSEILAGGIPQSGLIALTGQPDEPPLSSVFVVIGWGGDKDIWRGSAGGVSVPRVNFATEAIETSMFYHAQPNVGHAYCRIKEGSALSGHRPLPITGYLVDRLLEHPKGMSGASGVVLPDAELGEVRCGVEPLTHADSAQVDCRASTKSGCQASCQLIADCGVENDLIFDVLKEPLSAIGFTKTACVSCPDNCEANSGGVGDVEVLACLEAAQAGAVCGQGLAGALPLINGVNNCCAGRDSQWCDFLCEQIQESAIALTQFTACQ